MNRVYITYLPSEELTQPLSGFSIAPKLGEAKCHITPIVANTSFSDDKLKIIIIRPEGRRNNLSRLRAELDTFHREYEIQSIFWRPDELVDVYSEILEELTPKACYYADVSAGGPLWSMTAFAALTYVDRIIPETEVMGIYTVDGKGVKDLSAIFTLTSMLNTIADMRPPDEDMADAFRKLLPKHAET